MPEFLYVVTTTAKKDEAQKIADRLVEARLAGCVQVQGPISSTYRWEGEIQHDEEWLCIVKTAAEKYGQVEREISRLHSYTVPQIVALPIFRGGRPYLDWLAAELDLQEES